MSTIDYSTLDETLQQLVNFAPVIKKLFTEDVSINISDSEKVIFQSFSEELSKVNVVGNKLTAQDPMLVVMRNNREMTLNIPKELYGTAVKVAVAPITNKQGKVIGSISLSTSINNRVELIDVAEKFATSSEEIGVATEQLSTSAENLSGFMLSLIHI